MTFANELGDRAILAEVLPYSDHQLLADRSGQLLSECDNAQLARTDRTGSTINTRTLQAATASQASGYPRLVGPPRAMMAT